jgi:hypothetical protein
MARVGWVVYAGAWSFVDDRTCVVEAVAAARMGAATPSSCSSRMC